MAIGQDDTDNHSPTGLTRRSILIGLPLTLAACQTSTGLVQTAAVSMYDSVTTEPFPVPAVDLSMIDPAYYRRTIPVPDHIPYNPGEVVVDPYNHYLYYILADGSGTTIRLGCGVGRAGFEWAGAAIIGRKAAWPTWTPPPAMVARDPAARPWANGMPGGPDNPLGARALYLYRNGNDTLYRIHGTNQPWSIGQSMSSGCIRLLNQDVIYLHDIVPVGTRVTVLSR